MRRVRTLLNEKVPRLGCGKSIDFIDDTMEYLPDIHTIHPPHYHEPTLPAPVADPSSITKARATASRSDAESMLSRSVCGLRCDYAGECFGQANGFLEPMALTYTASRM